MRNRVIHRYIISFLKTLDIAKLAYKYNIINEKIRLIMKKYEEMQYGKGFGIYGRGFSKDDELDEIEYRRVYSLANDKHQMGNFKRKIEEQHYL